MAELIRVQRKHALFWIVKSDDGIELAKKKHEPGDTKQSLAAIFKRNRTLDKDVKITPLVNVDEIVDTRPGTRRPKGNTQYVVELILPDKTVIRARSLQSSRTGKKNLRQEAFENAYYLLAEHFGLGYDSEKGEAVFLEMASKVKIKEGFVRYRAKRDIQKQKPTD